MFPSLPDAAQQARLHDLAKAEAIRLRSEAIDDFWRSAARLRARLVHRASGVPSSQPSGV